MANTINIDANGGTYTANVNFSPSSCGSGSVTFTPQQNWLHANGYTFTIDKNTSGQRTGYIKMSYNGTECPQHMITVEQEGIPCTCDSFRFSDWITEVPQAGLAAGSTIFKCTPTGDCSVDGIVGTITVGSTVHTLTGVSTGNMNLQDSIPPNTASTDIGVVIKCTYNGTNCESATRNISQPGTGCGCGSFNSFSASIPLEGLATGGSQVGTYTITNRLCSETDLSATLVGDGHTYSLRCSGEKMYLANEDSIPRNTSVDGIPFTLSWKYKNTPCNSINVEQPGTGCGCGNLTSVSFITIPTEGVTAQTVIGSYVVQGDCEFTVTSSTLSLSTDDNHNIITDDGIPATTDPTGETFSVDVMFNGSSCSACTVTQSGTGCGCGTLHDVTFIDIPSGGVRASDNYEIGTYTTDSDVCNYTFAEVNNSFTMRGDNDTGKIIVTSDIPANTGYEPIDFTVIAKYGSDECVRSAITQEGTLKCDCESIGLMVTLMKTSFPKSGTTAWEDEGAGQGWVLVATGDTHGCGYLSGVSESTLLEEPKVKIVELGNYQYNFFIKVKSSTTPNDESAGLKVYFRKKDEAQFDDNCYKIFYITQSYDYCECTNFPVIEKDYSTIQSSFITVNVPFDGDSILISTDDIYNSLQCYDIELSTRTSWININDFKKYLSSAGDYHESTWVDITSNPSTARTGAFFIECYVDRQGIPYITSPGNVIYNKGYGGKLCKVITVNVEQEAHVECNCENSGFDEFDMWPHTNPFLREYDACAHENVEHTFKLNCGELTYKFKDGTQPDWITVSIDNVNKKMYLNVTKNEGEERNTSILFYPIIDGVECDTNPFEYQIKQVKLICDDCDVIKSYITAYSTYGCYNGNTYYIGLYPDSDCLCGSISAVTCDEYGNEISNPDVLDITYPRFSNAYNPKATFTENNTGSDRDFYFKLFVVDNDGHRIPNDDCYKISHVCQEYHIAPECACSAYTSASVSQNGYTSGLTAGTGEHKVGKLTLTRRSEEMPVDCLEIVVSSTHSEIAECWLDENNEINIKVVDELADDVVHPATVDVNIFDTSKIDPDTQGHVKCTFPLMRIELSITPNRPKPTN